jgi:hypothetical protein
VAREQRSGVWAVRAWLVRTFPGLRTLKRWAYRASDRLAHLSGAWRLRRTVQRKQLIRDLGRLNDVLAQTPLAGRYWVHGGVLLGWARDGKLLLNDLEDVDLAYRAEDRASFEAAIPSLIAAGFRLICVFHTLDGRTTIERFQRGRFWYEFFAMWPALGKLHAYSFSYGTLGGEDTHVEHVHEYPDDRLVPFSFLGRTWLKPANHEAYLEANYGNWRVEDRGFTYLNSPSIIDRRPCSNPETIEERLPATATNRMSRGKGADVRGTTRRGA